MSNLTEGSSTSVLYWWNQKLRWFCNLLSPANFWRLLQGITKPPNLPYSHHFLNSEEYVHYTNMSTVLSHNQRSLCVQLCHIKKGKRERDYNIIKWSKGRDGRVTKNASLLIAGAPKSLLQPSLWWLCQNLSKLS